MMTDVFVLVDISLKSPGNLFIFITNIHIYRIEVSIKYVILDFEKKTLLIIAGLSRTESGLDNRSVTVLSAVLLF